MAGESKTEKASPKKRRDERKKGNVFQSKDVASAFSIIAIFYTIKLMMPFVYNHLSNLIIKYIGYTKTTVELTTTFVMHLLFEAIIALFIAAGPVMLVAMVVGIIASGAQTKFIFSKDSLKPKFSRISFIQGVKRLFSLRSVIELLKSLIKVIIIGYVLYSNFIKISNNVTRLLSVDILQGVIFITDCIMDMVISMTMVFLVIAGFDFLYQWWDYEKNLRMSKQEVKEEYKHMEGDPQIKGKIKEKQRQIAMQRMMQSVPTADVIIRNPTHFAVALRYNIEKDRAPIVVAKGQDQVALRIIDVAKQHDIPITENVPLARALYSAVEINMEIPGEFYTVLAEIMAWVYSLKKENKKD